MTWFSWGIRLFDVFYDDVEDTCMQNIVVLAVVDRQQLIPGVGPEDYRSAMHDLMAGRLLQKNLQVSDRLRQLRNHS